MLGEYSCKFNAIESYQTSLRYFKIEKYFNLGFLYPIFVRMVSRGNAVSENAK